MEAPSADNISTFVEVVRRQSLSAAARRLGLPKSTVSRRLQRLEEQLGIPLLHRDARRVTMTQQGRRLYESAAAAVDALDEAVLGLVESSSQPRGVIRLTAPADLGRMQLSPLLVAFLEQYPEISLDLLFTNRIVDLIEEGVDLAVRAAPIADTRLYARKLMPSELQLAAARGRGPALGRDVQMLTQQPFVLYCAASGRKTLRLERQGSKRKVLELMVTGRVSVDDYASMSELVAAGQGVGLLPRMHLDEGIRTGRLERIFPEYVQHAAPVHLVLPTRKPPTRVRLLSDFLLQRCRSEHDESARAP